MKDLKYGNHIWFDVSEIQMNKAITYFNSDLGILDFTGSSDYIELSKNLGFKGKKFGKYYLAKSPDWVFNLASNTSGCDLGDIHKKLIIPLSNVTVEEMWGYARGRV